MDESIWRVARERPESSGDGNHPTERDKQEEYGAVEIAAPAGQKAQVGVSQAVCQQAQAARLEGKADVLAPVLGDDVQKLVVYRITKAWDDAERMPTFMILFKF